MPTLALNPALGLNILEKGLVGLRFGAPRFWDLLYLEGFGPLGFAPLLVYILHTQVKTCPQEGSC